MADNSGNVSSENSSAPGSRNGSVGGLKQARPKQNVKFSVGGNNSDEEQQPKRHSLPEIRLSTGPDLGEVPLSPLPARELTDWASRKDAAALNAFDRANRHANKVKQNNSLPVSRRSSLDNSSTLLSHSPTHISPPQKALVDHPIQLDDVPLADLSKSKRRSHYDIAGDSTDSDTDEDAREQSLKPTITASGKKNYDEARKLVRTFTRGFGRLAEGSGIQQDRSGFATPAVDQRSHEYEYVPVPDQYKPSVLSMLLASQFGQQLNDNRSTDEAQQDQTNYLAAKLAPYQDPKTDPRQQQTDFFSRKQKPSTSGYFSGSHSPYSPYESSGQSSTSGRATPRQKRPKWYKDEFQAQSNSSVAHLLGSASMAMASATPGMTPLSRPPMSRKGSSGMIDQAINVVKHPISHIRRASASNRTDLRSHVLEMHTMNIAERIASQKYLLKMCRALMALGAPTHRLEEYLQMASRKLLVAASFQYMPGCMIVAFDDPTTHTTEVHLVKEPTQVDLGKLQDVQEVYKDVMHDKYSVDEAITDMREILTKPKKFSTPILILIYGVASVSVGPFAFSAQPKDFPISFLLGCVLGFLQLGLASRSTQFSHIFEVAGAFATSFAARGFGSIYNADGTPAFCFSALAQSSIALILPGWIILSAALELQSRNLVAGSVRLIFAVIYTLFLGFGILLGATFMGLFYSDSTNDITCHLPDYWNATDHTLWKLIYTKFIWVPIFTLCLAMANQAKWKQMPWMVFISVCGYQVNYWSGRRFSQNNQIANALGALTIGVLANLYSRLGHGVAAATMLPAIFVMVPSGLAASGSLIAGLSGANQITHNVTGIAFNRNGTQTFYNATDPTGSSDPYGNSIFDVGAGMIQVAIAISVGLFLSALIVYPFGKKRSALFSF